VGQGLAMSILRNTSPRTNLPAQRPSLFGRDEALADVRQLVLQTERGLLTLTGTGGSGKTVLALAVAEALIGSTEFPDGVFLVELAPLHDPDLVPGVISATLGIKERSEQAIDLGHGYCRHEFFAQCPHRLACVRCPFYEPKDSQRLLVLEAEGNLIRLRQDLYLTEEEQSVIDGDLVAYRALRQTQLGYTNASRPHATGAGRRTTRVKR
jgi:hypothetical protein